MSKEFEEAYKKYNRQGHHLAFEDEFRALCDKFKVQALCSYGGFDGVVPTEIRAHNKNQVKMLLLQTKFNIEKILAEIDEIIVGKGENMYIKYDRDPK